MKKLTVAATVAAAAALTLAGCTPPIPVVSEAPQPEQAAAIVDAQVDRILPETFAELAAADEAKDPTLFTDRIGGQFVAVRAAEYKQAAAKDGPAVSQIPSSTQAVYVSGADTWPRTLVAVTTAPADELTPVVMLWIQDDVTSDYQLRATAHMIPGATLPAMPSEVAGALPVALDDDSLGTTPQALIDSYVKLLTEGATSDAAATFADDTYRERIFTARTVLTKAARAANGSYTDTVATNADGTYAIRTADGGTLIFAPVAIQSTFVVKNATVSVPATDQPLVEGKLTTQVVHHYWDSIVMYQPGPATDAKPTVVAADHNLIKVSAK